MAVVLEEVTMIMVVMIVMIMVMMIMVVMEDVQEIEKEKKALFMIDIKEKRKLAVSPPCSLLM